jgi:hypothetical protein
MNRSTILVVAAACLMASTAQAQSFRTYLASYGNDANPCSVAAPCRLLPAALAAVASGGEIWILDSANYNSGIVNIAKHVTILAIPGQVGSIVSFAGGPAITVTSAVKVKLRNLAIANNANNNGTDGIQVSGGGDLTVEGSVISVQGTGILVTNATARVHDTVIRDSDYGVQSVDNSNVNVANSRIANIALYGVYANGVTASTSTRMSVSDSTITNCFVGVMSLSDSGAPNVSVTRTTVSECRFGVASVGTGASLSIANSTLVNNTGEAMHENFSAVLETMGNNFLRNNGANSGGVITSFTSF